MMGTRTLRHLAATLGLCSALATLTVANAQTEPASGDTKRLQEVVVTGSLIARSAKDQPVPVSTISQKDIAKTGFSNLSDVLTQMPEVGYGVGPTDGNLSDYGPDAGATFIDLRGLGTNRTLVLVDGLRRVSGSSSSSAVDLATIPSNMIERVDVTTGGAAAVYGADAVSGVVNVILRHDFNGVELTGQTGISGYGDDPKTSVGVLFGTSLGDGSHLTFAASWNHEPAVYSSARPFGTLSLGDFPNPNITPSNPYANILYSGATYPNTSYGGAFVINNTRYTIGANGQLRPTQNGATPYGPLGYLGVGGGDGFDIDNFDVLRSASTVLSTLTDFTKEFGDHLLFTQDFQYSNSQSQVPLQPLFEYADIINRDNPLLPASVAALMDANGLTDISVGRTDWDQGINVRRNDRDTWTTVSKLEGDIGSDLTWNTFYQFGRYDNESIFTDDRIQSRYQQALNVVEGPNGPECADSAAVAAGCEPLDIFGPNAATPLATQYFHYNPVTDIINTQQVAGAQLSGKLFNLPAGPISFSSGVEYRRETEKVTQDPLAASGALFFTYGPSSEAAFNVKEAFLEALAPILTDKPFAKVLEFETADRVSEYDTIGRTNTWELGTQWAPSDDIRFRIMRASSVRAPNLTELDSPGSTSLSGYYDPCSALNINLGSSTRAANCAKLGIPANYVDSLAEEARLIDTVGNPNLKPETARSWTVGGVLTPHQLPGLLLSADWWSIDIYGAINTLPVQDIVNGCVDAASINNPFCPLVVRGHSVYGGGTTDPYAITVVNVSPINIGVLEAEGVDFKSMYTSPWNEELFNAPSRFSVSLNGTYYIKNDSIVNENDPSDVVHMAGDSTLPRLRINLTPEVDIRSFSLAWSVRYIAASKVDIDDSLLFDNDNNVASRTYNDVYATYVFAKPQVQLSFGINNLFNVAPPLNASTYEGTGAGALYDNIGRYFFMRVAVKR